MQHYAVLATLQHEILFTHKNENQKQSQHTTNTFHYMPHQCQRGNTSSKSTGNSKPLEQCKPKLHSRRNSKQIWLKKSMLAFGSMFCLPVCYQFLALEGMLWYCLKVLCVIHKHDCILRTCKTNKLYLLHYKIITTNQWTYGQWYT